MTEQKTGESVFQKVLVAPCIPKINVLPRTVTSCTRLPAEQTGRAEPARNHYFLSAKGNGKRSKFGCVKRTERPFNVQEFVAEHTMIDQRTNRASHQTLLGDRQPSRGHSCDRIVFSARRRVTFTRFSSMGGPGRPLNTAFSETEVPQARGVSPGLFSF